MFMQNFLDPNNVEIIFRLLVAVVCGMAIGAERTLAHKTAGMRTCALVSMGAALFVVISEYMVMSFGDNFGIDPFRMASAVVSGVGFLGAGLIFMRDNEVKGVTTASSIWVAAGIGIACGFGMYIIGISATIITLFIFVFLWSVEERFRKLKIYQNKE